MNEKRTVDSVSTTRSSTKVLQRMLSAAAVLFVLCLVFAAPASAADGNVAKVGDTEYATLKLALDNSQAGDTITLIADCMTEGGPYDYYDFSGRTLDLNQYTLRIGSFASLVFIGTDFTIKNGFVEVADGIDDPSSLWIGEEETYAYTTAYNVTVRDVITKAAILTSNAHNVTLINVTATDEIQPAVKSVWGSTDIVILSGTYNGKDDAILSYDGTTGAADPYLGAITVYGGLFSSDPKPYLPNEGYGAEQNADGLWVVFAEETESVAQVGENYYASLQRAVQAAGDGQTVTLLKDVELTSDIAITDKKLTLDLNGNTLSGSAYTVLLPQVYSEITIKNGTIQNTGSGSAVIAHLGAVVTFENIELTSASGIPLVVEYSILSSGGAEGAATVTLNESTRVIPTAGNYAIVIQGPTPNEILFNITEEGAADVTTLIINDGTINGPIFGNGAHDNTEITINGGTINGGDGVGIYHPQNGALTINGGTITGETAVYFKSGSLSITDGTLAGTGDKVDYEYVSSGVKPTGEALVIENVTSQFANGQGYDAISSVSITGGTFTSDNAAAVGSYAATTVNPDAVAVTDFITGGTFSSDVSTYVEEGYVCVAGETAGTYRVKLANPVAKIGETSYSSLQAAVDAAYDGDTIVIIDDVVLKAQDAQPYMKPAYNRESYCGIYIPDDKILTIDLAGHNVSYYDEYDDVDNVMVLNLGNLTINDSLGGGKLSYTPVRGSSSYSKFYSTIFNCGILTINGGTIENCCETDVDVTNAVDCHSRLSHEYGNDCILIVNNGTLKGASYYSIRQYTHYLEGVKNHVIINNGTFYNGIYMQHGDQWYYADPSKKRLNVDCYLTINGGTFYATYEGASPVVSKLNNPDNNAWGLEIKGGTFTGDPIKLRIQRGTYYENGVSGTTVPAETTGARNAEWLATHGGFITGGTFTTLGDETDVTTNLTSFLADGYALFEENGSYAAKKAWKIGWYNDGVELYNTTVAEGETPEYMGATPTKEETDQFTYEFTGWNPTLSAVTADTNYHAVFSESLRSYTITWMNDVGETLKTEDVAYGTIPSYGDTNPTKDASVEYTYEFTGWYPEPVGVTGPATYEAIFTASPQKYNLTFYVDEVLHDSIDLIPYGSDISNIKERISTEISSPEKSGHNFIGWNLILENLLPDTMPAYDIDLKAEWAVNQYTITFNTDGGTEIASITQDYGSSVTAPAAPTKEGYTFAGWDKEIPATMPAESLTITAKWTVNKYTITFDTDGGTEIAPITQDYGTDVTAPADPTKTGYTFAGWDKDIPATMPAEDMTITATWTINQYTITFDTDGGSEIAAIKQDYGTSVEAPDDPTKTGYTFAGWDKEIPATMPAEDVTITAKWTVNKYTITFDTDGGTEIAPITQDYGTDVTAPDDPTKTGYTFAGWDKEIPATMPAESLTITAKWTINQYTITFNTDGGSAIAPITQDYDTAVTAPADPTRTGYTFAGWDKEIPATMPAESLTITAKWDINQYTITFNTDGGSAIAPITQDYGTAVTAPADPTRTGYTFAGWDTEIPATMPAEDMTITATWTINQYTITFDTDGGSEIAPIKQDYGTSVEAPDDPTKTGYTFAGWDKEIPATMPAEDLKITATWTINQYTITFDTVGGTEIAAITQDYGTAVTAPADPTKTGYTFAGWDKEIPATMPAGDMTITAQWTVNQYTITFDTDGGTEIAPIKQDYGTAVTAPVAPTKEGYTFAGWDKEIPATMPAESLTITAKWDINQYTITFDTAGGSEIAPIKQDYGTAVTAPADPTKTGYTFAGWDKEIPATMPAGDMTITAQWDINQYTITFDTDGGTEIAPIKQDYGTAVTAPVAPTKEGYTFAGWDKEIPATMPAGDMTITAQWDINQYTITFDTDGGTEIAPITQDYGTDVTAPADPTKTGYTFAGWDKEIPATMPAEDVTITAQWTVNKYTIKFVNDGTELQSTEVAYGENPEYTGETPTKEATPEYTYTFAGWDNETGQHYPVDTPLPKVDKDVTYTANFTANPNEYIITFDTVGGTTISSRTVSYGSEVTAPENPTKTGYTFANWNRTFPFSMPAENITIKASWTPIKYTITWMIEGKSTTQQVDYDQIPVYTGELPTKAENTTHTFTFAGWNPTPGKVTGAATYTALFNAVAKEIDEEDTEEVEPEIKPEVKEDKETGNVTIIVNPGTESKPANTTTVVSEKNATIVDSDSGVKMEIGFEEKPEVTTDDAGNTGVTGKIQEIKVTYPVKAAEVDKSHKQENKPVTQEVVIKFENITTLPTINSTIKPEVEEKVKEKGSNNKIIAMITASTTAEGGIDEVNKHIDKNDGIEVTFTIPKDLVVKIGGEDRIKVFHVKNDQANALPKDKVIVKLNEEKTHYIVTIKASGFSSYVVGYEEPTPTPTPAPSSGGSSSANYQTYVRDVPASGVVDFGTSRVVKGMELPDGSSGKVTLNVKPTFAMPENGYYAFEIAAPGYNTAAKIYGSISFQIPVADLTAKGFTEKDIVLFHGVTGTDAKISWEKLATTLVKVENSVAYYKAAISGCSPFYVGFVKDGSVVNEPVVEPTPSITDVPGVVPTADVPIPTETPASPAPLLGLLAGLGAAAVLRRK